MTLYHCYPESVLDGYSDSVFERNIFITNVPLKLALIDPHGAILIDSLLGGDGLPSAAIQRIGAVLVDCDNNGIVESHSDAIGANSHKIGVVLQFLCGTLVSTLVDQFGRSSLEVHDDFSVGYHHRVQ